MNAGVFVVCGVLLAASVTAVPISYSQDGHLHVLEASNNILEAIFFNAEMGIRISSDSDSLSIVSMVDNEVLVSGQKPQGSSSKLTSVMGSTFVKFATTNQEGVSRNVEYSVPKTLIDQTKEALEAGKEDRLSSLLGEQNETETRTTVSVAFERLFERPELGLLESASFALGRAGVLGQENQGALNFYGVAMAVVKQLYRQSEGSGQVNRDQEMQQGGEGALLPQEREQGRFKRLSLLPPYYGWCGWSWCYCLIGFCCPTRPSPIPIGPNPIPIGPNPNLPISKEPDQFTDTSPWLGAPSCNGYCPVGEYCLGRCGPGCWWCWWFVCSTCCFHQGCYDHDVRCGEDYCTTGCMIPFPFSCDGWIY